MKRAFLTMLLGTVVASCTPAESKSPVVNGGSAARHDTMIMANRATQPSVLVMGEDWDQDTIPRNSRVFNRVLQAITSQLRQEGFPVKNETAVTQEKFIQGRVRRNDDELFRVAKAIRNPVIDAVVVFKIYPQAGSRTETAWVNAVVSGYMLNVSTGDQIGDFETTFPENLYVSKDCTKNRECMLKEIGDNSRVLGGEVGAVLAIQLRRAALGSRNQQPVTDTGAGMVRAYNLTFDNFRPNELNRAEELMSAFTGYHRHHTGRSGLRNAEFTYETRAEDSNLKRNLRQMIEYMGLQASVNCVARSCTITKF